MPNQPPPSPGDRSLFLRDKTIPLFTSRPGLPTSAKNTRFLCPTCGESWAKLVLSPSLEWFFSTTPCIHHGTKHRRGGSVLAYVVFHFYDFGFPTRQSLIESLSRPLIEHETLLKVKQLLSFQS